MTEPRSNFRVHHSLVAILTITLCALICGADGFGDIAFFGRSKKDWFDTFLDLPY
ncbi:MAG: transposase family protein, partial [Synergistaceae bacterium]|nr:transposase family protein [Synergistaceae bacterium]